MKFNLTKPCKHCPFRHDVNGYLTGERAKEIATEEGTFACHKTTVYDEDVDDLVQTKNSKHCAGFLIFREKQNKPSQAMRIAERLGMYDRTQLDMTAPVFDSVEELCAHHSATERAYG
jgi:hypothetical protein